MHNPGSTCSNTESAVLFANGLRKTYAGRAVVEGTEVARFMAERAPDDPALESPVVGASARNRLTGIVTRVVRDTVMAQVELQVGPHRMVSLMSREAADELGLAPGVPAAASIKATNVVVDIER